jgi:tRNA pseudouridine38-40 synthase
LQAALGRVTGESPLPQGSGRTDAGVHALGQVASFELRANIPADNLLRALNRTLPPAIRILESKTVRSISRSALDQGKTYEYRVFRSSGSARRFWRATSTPVPGPWTSIAARVGARLFEGEHNFLSFAATDPDLAARKNAARMAQIESSAKVYPAEEGETDNVATMKFRPGKHGAVRTIFSSAWEQRFTEDGEVLVYRARGNGFLHHMVRNLVGTMLDVGRGYTPLEAIPGMLAARSRDAAGPTAPAQGLFLHSVDYNCPEIEG